jgi:hypothetical protein
MEGGAATAAYNTERADKQDIELAVKFVSKHTGIPTKDLIDNLLGSTKHTLSGKKKDSGDIDIAVRGTEEEQAAMVEKMKQATGMDKVHRTGDGVFSFAVPTVDDKRVQVDLMIVPSVEWARFGFHSEHSSKYRGAIRNLLLVNLMKNIFEDGKDFVVKDGDKEIIRVRRRFTMDRGLKREFRMAAMRKDGKGRVAAMGPVSPEEVEAELKKLGLKKTFSKNADPIYDPDKAAAFMFGKGVKGADIMSAEQVIALIKKRKGAAEIFKDSVADFVKNKLETPEELKQYA